MILLQHDKIKIPPHLRVDTVFRFEAVENLVERAIS
jgi:hypothetical protein